MLESGQKEMDNNIFNLRRIYFISLYSSFIYISLLLIILRDDVSPFEFSILDQVILGAFSILPAGLFIYRKTKNIFKYKTFIKILYITHIPLFIAFILSLYYSNYLFFLTVYPVFILTYLIIIPLKRGSSQK